MSGPTVRLASADAVARARRVDRLDARASLWQTSHLPRLRRCGREVIGDGVQVRMTAGEAGRVVGFGGVETCGSVWACPCCSAKVLAERRGELEAALSAWRTAPSRQVAHLVLTMRHRQGQSLEALWAALSDAWNRATSGSRGWKSDKALVGAAGWVRVVEVTHGRNGWHVHVHCLVFADLDTGDLSAALEDDERWRLFGKAVFGRWARALQRHGFAAPIMGKGGLYCRQVIGDLSVMGDYFTKNVYQGQSSAAAEVAFGPLKSAHAGHRTPFQVLADTLAGGVQALADLRLWWTWEKASKGKRMMTWARGFRDLLGLGVAREDDEIAAEEVGSSSDTLVVIPRGAWYALVVSGLGVGGRLAGILTAAEDGYAALVAYLDALAIPWEPPGSPPLPAAA